MQKKVIFRAFGVAPVLLIVGACMLPQELQAQQPNAGVRPRMEAQVQANLDGLELQKRQASEWENQQIHDLEEQTAEQIVQLRGDTDRQMELARKQLNRQIERIRSQTKRQIDLLEAQINVVKAQAGLPPTEHPITKAVTAKTPKNRSRPSATSSIEEKLDKLIDHLERVDRRLDKLEGKK
jgi:hypothetical protein